MEINYDDIAQYCKENWADITKKTIEIANDVCENKFIFDMSFDLERCDKPTVFDNGIDWLYKKNGDQEFMFQMNRHHYFITLAQAFRFTKDDKYILKLKDLMTNWIDTVKCPKKNIAGPWRTLETGLRGEFWTLAIDILKDNHLIDDEFLNMYHDSLHTHAKVLLNFYSINNYQSNWGVIESHGLFDIGIELNNEEYINTALERLYTQANHQIMADGVHWEQSCLYHNEVLNCFLDVIFRAKKNNIKLKESFLSNVKRLAMVNVAWIKPNNKCPLLGDSDYNDVRDILTKSAIAFNNGIMKYLAFDNADFDTVWILGVEINGKYQEIEKVKPNYNSVSLNDSGNFILRNDFSENSNYLLFHNGYTGAGHAHEDKLSFEFSIGKDDILMDCGRYTYLWNKERKHLKSFKAHNTVCVDNKHFIEAKGWEYKSFAPTIKGTFTQNDKFEYLSSSHIGYLNIKRNDYVFVNRSIVWLKPDIYLIIDEFDTKGRHTYNQFFNFAPNGKVEINGNSIKYFAKNSMAYIKSFANNIKLENTVGLYSDHYNEIENINTVKTTFKGKGKAVAITVLIANNNEKYKNISVDRCDVFSDKAKRYLELPNAFGIKINLDQEEHTVIFSLKELLWVLFCNGKSASAKITWYKNDEYTVIQW